MNVYAKVVRKVEDENSRVKGYVNLTLEDCCLLRGTMVLENQNGELYVRYPQKPVFENGEPKLREDGKQEYTDVYYGKSKEVNDTIKECVLAAYNSEEGYAYVNPQKGERTNSYIEPNLHACNGETVKAAGKLLIGDYMRVTDVFVNLRTDKDGEKFLGVSFPSYMAKDGSYKELVEPLEKGKRWNKETKQLEDYNFAEVLERVIKKQTREFHPELADVLKSSVQERIDEAKETAAKANEQQGKEAPEMEQTV